MPAPKAKLSNSVAVLDGSATHADGGADFSGQRRLIRPTISARAAAQAGSALGSGRQPAIFGRSPALTSRSVQPSNGHEESSHAEAFYFQKQIQSQTRMVVVLDNGEQIEGVIEWYDRHAIKLRNLGRSNGGSYRPLNYTRMLVYKAAIRYIYKAGENAPQTMT
jgi:sRNA-binding regulator protein Hfq